MFPTSSVPLSYPLSPPAPYHSTMWISALLKCSTPRVLLSKSSCPSAPTIPVHYPLVYSYFLQHRPHIFILGFSSFNLHHFILGGCLFWCSTFSPYIYSSLCVNLCLRLQSRCHHHVSHSALDSYVTKTYLFHSQYNPFVEHKHTRCYHRLF